MRKIHKPLTHSEYIDKNYVLSLQDQYLNPDLNEDRKKDIRIDMMLILMEWYRRQLTKLIYKTGSKPMDIDELHDAIMHLTYRVFYLHLDCIPVNPITKYSGYIYYSCSNLLRQRKKVFPYLEYYYQYPLTLEEEHLRRVKTKDIQYKGRGKLTPVELYDYHDELSKPNQDINNNNNGDY